MAPHRAAPTGHHARGGTGNTAACAPPRRGNPRSVSFARPCFRVRKGHAVRAVDRARAPRTCLGPHATHPHRSPRGGHCRAGGGAPKRWVTRGARRSSRRGAVRRTTDGGRRERFAFRTAGAHVRRVQPGARIQVSAAHSVTRVRVYLVVTTGADEWFRSLETYVPESWLGCRVRHTRGHADERPRGSLKRHARKLWCAGALCLSCPAMPGSRQA